MSLHPYEKFALLADGKFVLLPANPSLFDNKKQPEIPSQNLDCFLAYLQLFLILTILIPTIPEVFGVGPTESCRLVKRLPGTALSLPFSSISVNRPKSSSC